LKHPAAPADARSAANLIEEVDKPFHGITSLDNTEFNFQSSDVTVIEELELPLRVPSVGGRYCNE
jgi:hypothetical protein